MLATSPKIQFNQDMQIAIQDIVSQYESVHNINFDKRRKQLLQQLQQQTKDKKKQLLFYKKMLTQENLQRLISQRRREKQKERQNLQSRWRECNESYKKLLEEQKTLINQHKENLFDAKKLQQKIVQFQSFYDKLQEKLQNISKQRQTKFMTQPRQKYRSPYKKEKSIDMNQSLSHLKLQKLNQSQTVFFSQKYSLNKYLALKSQTPLKSNAFNQFNKTTHLINKAKIKTVNTNYSEKHPQKYCEKDYKQNSKEQLFKFLLNPKIKQKIFQILYRKL